MSVSTTYNAFCHRCDSDAEQRGGGEWGEIRCSVEVKLFHKQKLNTVVFTGGRGALRGISDRSAGARMKCHFCHTWKCQVIVVFQTQGLLSFLPKQPVCLQHFASSSVLTGY